MDAKQIQTIGNFLTYYRNDLNYIQQFQHFKSGGISIEEYTKKYPGSFYAFLIDFRIIRNIPSQTADKLLEETSLWIKSSECNDVDLFARRLQEKGLTHGKIMASMASKILFLNNPWEIIPMDTLARKTLKQNQNNYSEYNVNVTKFRQEEKSSFEDLIKFINPLTKIIHADFENVEKLDLICENRMLDKLLWTKGKR